MFFSYISVISISHLLINSYRAVLSMIFCISRENSKNLPRNVNSHVNWQSVLQATSYLSLITFMRSLILARIGEVYKTDVMIVLMTFHWQISSESLTMSEFRERILKLSTLLNLLWPFRDVLLAVCILTKSVGNWQISLLIFRSVHRRNRMKPKLSLSFSAQLFHWSIQAYKPKESIPYLRLEVSSKQRDLNTDT